MIHEYCKLKYPTALDRKRQVRAVKDGNQVCIFILVLHSDFVATGKLASEHSLHHQYKFIVCYVFVVYRDAAYVIAQLRFYNKFAT